MPYYVTSFIYIYIYIYLLFIYLFIYFIVHPLHKDTRHVKFTTHYRHFIWLEGHSHALQCDNSPYYLAVTRVNFADEDKQRIQTDDTGNAMVLEPVTLGITGMFGG
jgi:hypothetical protein